MSADDHKHLKGTLIDRLKRHWLPAVIVGPMLLYGIVKGGGEAIATFISRWATERADRIFQKPPISDIQTGTIKPSGPQPDPYTKCLEDRHAEQARSRRRVEAARADLLKCTTAYKESAFWRRDRDADALAHCSEFVRIVLVSDAAAKSAEGWTCRRSSK